MTIGSPLLWGVFGALVLVVILLDLFVLGGNKAHTMRMREALAWSMVWITLALLFNLGLWIYLKSTQTPAIADEAALNFFTGYLIEKALSVDNLFVFVLIFSSFKIPAIYQRRVLLYGVLGAIVMRIIMIAIGAKLVQEFSWILYIFGAFLLVTGAKMFFISEASHNPQDSKVIKFIQKHIRLTKELHGEKFFIIQKGLLYATPLLMVLILIELSDLLFATDSIPAIFAITQDPFIVATSNIFAILGLRSLYFLLAGLIDRFHYLRYGLACILVLIGIKLLVNSVYHVSPLFTLLAIALILLLSVLVSVMRPQTKGL